jgi:hypothetical protein
MAEVFAIDMVQDCLYRERYKYSLTQPVVQGFTSAFSGLPLTKIELYDFSHKIPTAKILFQITHESELFLISGAFGLDYLTVTYPKKAEATEWKATILELIQMHA